jgi:hypothetical protein
VVLAPHRAVYDLVLDDDKPATSIEAARGRIAFDFTGDACEGYVLSFRQVTQVSSSEGGPRTIDARTTSFEAGDGASYRFKTESSAGGAPAEIVDGTARNPVPATRSSSARPSPRRCARRPTRCSRTRR